MKMIRIHSDARFLKILKIIYHFIEKNSILQIIFFLYISFFVIKGILMKDKIKESYRISKAYIYKTSRAQSGAKLYYFYYWNNLRIDNVQSYGGAYSLKNEFKGLVVPVAISNIDSSNSELLLNTSDFKKYNLERPKELNWID